jgi:hypothetical protein
MAHGDTESRILWRALEAKVPTTADLARFL